MCDPVACGAAWSVGATTNFFASCELLCEERGEVSVTNLKPILPGENRQDILPPKKHHIFPSQNLQKFYHFELWGALLHKRCGSKLGG